MGLLKLASVFASRPREARDDARATKPSGTRGDATRALIEQERLPEALAAIDRELADAAGDAGLLVQRAQVLRAWGREREAATTIAHAARAGTTFPDRWLGWASRQLGRIDDAVASYRRACEREPDDAGIARELATTLVAAARFDEASALYRELDARTPDDATLLRDWGVGELRAKRHDAALERFERLARLRPDDAAALEHLGVALSLADRTHEAVAALEQSLSLAARAPGGATPGANLAIGYAELARWDDAVRVLVDDLRETGDLAGHLQLGVALLALGRFANGWRQYEHRWLIEPLASIRARYGVPNWTGQPLAGRTVLVRSEQGLGDIFQFVRYVPMLKALGARVVFQPLKGMDAMSRRFPGVDEVVRDGERLPPFDYYANLMSLPLAFGTTEDTTPREIPYLSPDSAYAAKWRDRFADRARPRVGLAWAGRPQHRTDRHRSLTLAQLAPLLEVADVRFVSLQKGPAAVQAETIPDSIAWEGVGAELDDLDDAAAVLAELDLLVCVDTGLAHLAAAMGKPVWVMLPDPADYRWRIGREDTPWYPTMRLFRQPTPRDWASVVARVAAELARWRASWRTPGTTPARIDVREGVGRRAIEPHADEPPLAGLAGVAETRAGLMRILPDDDAVGLSLAYAGEWMPAALDVALRFVRPGMTLVDAGADVGPHAIPLARAVGYDGLVFAYEARPLHRRLLADNLKLHELPHATVMSRALGASGGEGFTATRECVDDLKLARLDGVRIGRAADATAIVAGAQDTLWRCRPWLLAEVEDASAGAPLADALRAHGYRCWRAAWPIVRDGNFNGRDAGPYGGATLTTIFAAPEEWDVGTAPDGWREVA